MNINKKSKKEQLFILVGMCVACLGILCVSGCGGQSCEKPKCASEEVGNGVGTITGISIPGLGGCSNSCLCEGILCAESHKLVIANSKGLNIAGCDTRYNTSDCSGCSSGNSCYSGCASYDDGKSSGCGLFYGGSKEDSPLDGCEQIVGCINGGFYCGYSDNGFGDSMEVAENILGID